MVGSLYLVAVCLLPDVLRVVWSVPFYFGGTSVLIVVVVIMDFIAQVQAQPDFASIRQSDEKKRI